VNFVELENLFNKRRFNLLKHCGQHGPQQLAIIYRQEKITYADWQKAVAKYITFFSQKVITSKAEVGIYLSNSPAYLYSLVALWELGITAVLLPKKQGPSQIEALKKGLAITTIIDEKTIEEITSCWDELLPYDKQSRALNFSDLALIVLSSGTTATPKKIELTFGNLCYSALGSAIFYNLHPADCWATPLPFNHVGGILTPLRTFLAGASLLIIPQNNALVDSICLHRPSFISMVPTQLQQLINHPNRSTTETAIIDALFSCKAILIGGDATPIPLVQKALQLNLPISLSYGMSETSAQVTATLPGRANIEQGVVSCGKVLPFRKLEVDSNNRIYIHGETLARNSKRSQEGYFYSGDLGMINADGELFVFGREDDMFISGGENIYPQEIEDTILQITNQISKAVVVPIDDELFGQVGVCLIEACDFVDPKNIKEELATLLPNYKIPKYFFIHKLLANSDNSGELKISRQKLKILAQQLVKNNLC